MNTQILCYYNVQQQLHLPMYLLREIRNFSLYSFFLLNGNWFGPILRLRNDVTYSHNLVLNTCRGLLLIHVPTSCSGASSCINTVGPWALYQADFSLSWQWDNTLQLTSSKPVVSNLFRAHGLLVERKILGSWNTESLGFPGNYLGESTALLSGLNILYLQRTWNLEYKIKLNLKNDYWYWWWISK